MKIDLFHNKIVKDTVSAAFAAAVENTLAPLITEKYGEVELLQMYEDHLGENFTKDGRRYYPFSLLKGGEAVTAWASFDVSDGKRFEGGVPYALIEGELDFRLHDSVPPEFTAAIEGRAGIMAEELVALDIQSASSDPTFLVGRFSQSFIDEMRRQLTAAIEREAGVIGLAGSSTVLTLVFAPDTYMEHTSENVTYRRLLIGAKGCAARDFWVKWTRLGSSSAFSVKDHVKEGEILFEIGEDVSHKIREKEYRFLVYGNADKYRSAMGRKNITEWRELIKRALKRGELERVESFTVAAEAEAAPEVSDELGALLARSGVTIPDMKEEKLFLDTTDSEFEAAMRMARIAAGYSEAPAPEVSPADEDALIMEMLSGAPEAKAADEVSFLEQIPEIEEEVVPASVPTVDEGELDALRSRNAELESELLSLRGELQAIRAERDELASALEATRAERRDSEERLREQLLLETKKNEREKALFIEAARLAKEENERLLRERAEAERVAKEDEMRREAALLERESELAREAEVKRIEAAREAELGERRRAEELKAEREERARRMAERLLGAEEVSAPAPVEKAIPAATELKPEVKPAPAPVAKPAPAPVNYTYTQKLVRLMFRHNVDPNVTARIQEMISVALDHFGKQHVYMRIKASIPEPSVVLLNFVKIPEEEMGLLVDIIKLLGNSDLGISKVTLE